VRLKNTGSISGKGRAERMGKSKENIMKNPSQNYETVSNILGTKNLGVGAS
jgi:hypothetical protein